MKLQHISWLKLEFTHKRIFLKNCEKWSIISFSSCPCSYRTRESLSLYILKTSNFRLFVTQNVPLHGALSTKNFCAKSYRLQIISFQSFQIGSGTPCRFAFISQPQLAAVASSCLQRKSTKLKLRTWIHQSTKSYQQRCWRRSWTI